MENQDLINIQEKLRVAKEAIGDHFVLETPKASERELLEECFSKTKEAMTIIEKIYANRTKGGN